MDGEPQRDDNAALGPHIAPLPPQDRPFLTVGLFVVRLILVHHPVADAPLPNTKCLSTYHQVLQYLSPSAPIPSTKCPTT